MTPPLARTLPDLLREQAERNGAALAAISGGRTATYADLLKGANRIAAALAGAGLRPGQRIGMILGNTLEWLEICFGAMIAGLAVVPLSTWSTRSKLAFLLPDSQVALLFAVDRFGDRDFTTDLRAVAPADLPVVILGQTAGHFAGYEAFRATAGRVPEGLPSAGADALVLYTSGSTSVPKGVRLKQYGIVENGFNIGERQGLRPGDRVLVSVPLFWSYGAANALPATISHGAAMVLLERFEAGAALTAIESYRCTAIYTLPAMTNAMVRHPDFDRGRIASLRAGLTIGSPQDVRFAAEQLGATELCNIYGSTETYGNCAVTDCRWPLDRRAACQGLPLPGQEIRIVGEDGSFVPQGEVGEVLVRGYVTPGYSGASAALNEAIFTPDGFYRTGDLGRLDEAGAFVFVGRSSEMIKRAGINVSPAEVEDVLHRHQGVAHAAVVGVPDAERGEAIVAFVVPTVTTVAPDELSRHCRLHLSKYKVPDRFEMCEALPLTTTGKLQRKVLRDRAIAMVDGKSRRAPA